MTLKISQVRVEIDPEYFNKIINRAVRNALEYLEQDLTRQTKAYVDHEVQTYIQRLTEKALKNAVKQGLREGLK